ncbi:MAG: hypothetical protein N838_06135 [Thiohalocapsa sp. PB-PSB1]|nr:MAG: hypothetical protein N838_06135 [Thiohalocapsa sp. PB-PSB1]
MLTGDIRLIEERVVVIAGNSEFVEVEAQHRGACSGCGVRAACGTSLLERFLGRRPSRLRVANLIDASVGEQVIVGVPEAVLLRTAASTYLLPLIGLILGAVGSEQFVVNTDLTSTLISTEHASLFGGVAGFVLAFQWSRSYATRIATNPQLMPVLLRRALPSNVESQS